MTGIIWACAATLIAACVPILAKVGTKKTDPALAGSIAGIVLCASVFFYRKDNIMGKKEAKTNAIRILETMKIPYEARTYECDDFVDAAQIADKLGLDHAGMYKTITTVGKSGGYYVFVVPIDDEIDFKKAAKAAGEKSIEMLHLKDLTKVTGYIRGGCTSIGMKKQYPTFIHEAAKEQDKITVSGGRLGLQITLAPDDLCRAAKAEYADIIK